VVDRGAILAEYDREMRADPPESSGATFEHEESLVRERGASETIVYANLTSATAPTAVHEAARRARSLGRDLEWKVYGHDRPPELPGLLAAAGFRADEPETLVVLDLRAKLELLPLPADLRVREVIDDSTFADALAASRAAFGPSGPEGLEKFRGRLDDPTARLFVAYLDGRPVAAGRLELPPGRAFAGLWGGGTAPEARHRGVYRALVGVRAERAARMGYRYITVDARETSRPILERLGFVALTGIRGWILFASEPASAPTAPGRGKR
jgi:GNAT superfamily N-acetyltransferase